MVTMVLRRTIATLVTALVVSAGMVAGSAGPQDGRPAPAADLCRLETSSRIVAIGDVHGAYDAFVRILQQAALVDDQLRWVGETAVLVQVGDLFDRGAESRRALDLVRRLEGDAARAGGRVVPLLGNHEVMRMMRDLRYVSAGEYAEFVSDKADELREAFYGLLRQAEPERARAAGRTFDEPAFRELFLSQIPRGFVEMQVAFEPGGEYGPWLRARGVIARINGIVFTHGGVTPVMAERGCGGIAEAARAELSDLPTADDPRAQNTLLVHSDGPLWNRDLALDDTPLTGRDITTLLRRLDARAIVVGHTPVPGGRIRTRFDNRVVQIDTGMLDGAFYPGGRASALEIDGDRVSAIYTDRRDELFQLPTR